MSTKTLFKAIKAQVGNAHAKLILIALADIANEKGECWPSHAYLQSIAEVSRSTVIRHLKLLESMGLISIIRRADDNGMRSTSVYRLHQIPDVSERHNDVSERHKGGVTVTQGWCHGDTGVVSQRHIDTPIDTPNDTLIDTQGVSAGNQFQPDNWNEWEQHRKEIKKALTPSTRAKQLKFLSQFDPATQSEIIDQSITNGWTGLFEVKNEKVQRDQPKQTPADRMRAEFERKRAAGLIV